MTVGNRSVVNVTSSDMETYLMLGKLFLFNHFYCLVVFVRYTIEILMYMLVVQMSNKLASILCNWWQGRRHTNRSHFGLCRATGVIWPWKRHESGILCSHQATSAHGNVPWICNSNGTGGIQALYSTMYQSIWCSWFINQKKFQFHAHKSLKLWTLPPPCSTLK